MIDLQEMLSRLKPHVIGWIRGALEQDGWLDVDDTLTYVSATSFSVVGDCTGMYQAGARLRLTQSTTTKYFVVVQASLGVGGVTTVTVTGGSDYSLTSSAISAVGISYQVAPVGWPGWFNWMPSYTGFSANPSGFALFAVTGRVCSVIVRHNTDGTSNGTGLTISLPIPAASYGGAAALTIMLAQGKDAGSVLSSPSMVVVNEGATSAICYKGLAALPWTNSGGKRCSFEGFYPF